MQSCPYRRLLLDIRSVRTAPAGLLPGRTIRPIATPPPAATRQVHHSIAGDRLKRSHRTEERKEHTVAGLIAGPPVPVIRADCPSPIDSTASVRDEPNDLILSAK